MKILHVITTLQTGGAEHLMVDLLPRLRDLGNEVELAVFNTSETPFYKELQAAGIKIHVFAGPGNVYNPLHIFRLLKLMRLFDIVHTHNTAPQLFAAIARVFCRATLCTTEHNTSNRRRQWRWYIYVDRWMYRMYNRVICISDQAATNLRKHLGDNNRVDICTIYNGVDISRFSDASPCEDVALKYKNLHTAVMVAGFRPQKDHDTLIKAYRHLPEDFHLLLVGDGERRNDLERLVQEVGLQERVHFLGIRTDVPSLLKSVEVVIMSSHYEGLSLSNVEGMASGRPFVASDVDGLREVTQGAGVLLPHGDDKALADVIFKLTTDSDYRDEVVIKCQERAMLYDIAVMAENYSEVYENLDN